MGLILPRFEKAHGKTEAEICRRIIHAIFEQRLPPGERLTEELLAETFDVSRTIVRQAMARLSQDGILVKMPNVGSTVASPSRKETRDILTVRRMVEPEIVRTLAASITASGLAQLHEHLEAEAEARKNDARGTLVRLVGEFHLRLAELTGNHVLVQLITRLQTLTCLAILLHAQEYEACPPGEHIRITDAIARRDGETAAHEMVRHLNHVEMDLKLDGEDKASNFSETMAWLRGA
ncbi:GntR family transcriptional regulator [Mesorhizobium sp. M7A.F.Ca.US.006.01.1.1]|uniref:GntR family transcriptional regulator n=1 Tax=Mesorhizobium sp. M7A.F.Ca.US.006.01.1.1 TaxID=2496707 RepID=UPI000FC9BB9E|nr:GntR family transcriptional regulator [Mesorhizobium sp. M7A.F.Ca.US.006.01.1.1]RUZ77865.1 GntR family transcriptional regulator [Mesorhizobium sp. M7A.F.Ca.US.006.01.1.1]